MNENYKAHLKQWSPAYIIGAIIAGGGGTAALTDNLPVTNKQFIEHQGGMHTQSSVAIDKINISLDAIQLEQTTNNLRNAYTDKCRASGAALEYIDKEIDRLEAIYFRLTKREYGPPPCLTT